MARIQPEIIAAANRLDDNALWQLLRARLGSSYNWTPLFEGADPVRIRDLLAAQATDLNRQMGERRHELAEFQDRCWQRGGGGTDAWLRKKGEYEVWRRDMMVMKHRLEARLLEARRFAEAKRLADHEERERQSKIRDREALRAIVMAVVDHQRACAADGIQPSRADIKLWGALDDITMPYGAGEITLSDAADQLWSDR